MEQADLKHHVFISYSRRDYVNERGEVKPGNSVSQIMDALEKAHISYWIDKEGIYHGDKFKGVLASAIEAADVFTKVSQVMAHLHNLT